MMCIVISVVISPIRSIPVLFINTKGEFGTRPYNLQPLTFNLLLHQHHFSCLHKVSGLQAVEINAT